MFLLVFFGENPASIIDCIVFCGCFIGSSGLEQNCEGNVCYIIGSGLFDDVSKPSKFPNEIGSPDFNPVASISDFANANLSIGVISSEDTFPSFTLKAVPGSKS